MRVLFNFIPDTLMQLVQNYQQYQHVLALCALLRGLILKGLTVQKFVSDICVSCMFYVSEVIDFVD